MKYNVYLYLGYNPLHRGWLSLIRSWDRGCKYMHCSLHRGCFFIIWNEHRYTLNIVSEWPGAVGSLRLEQEQSKKWKFFELCQQTAELNKDVQKMIPNIILYRKKRSEAAEQQIAVSISGSLKHRPRQIEISILHDFGDMFQNIQVVVTDHPTSPDNNCFDILWHMKKKHIFNHICHICHETSKHITTGHWQFNSPTLYAKGAYLWRFQHVFSHNCDKVRLIKLQIIGS